MIHQVIPLHHTRPGVQLTTYVQTLSYQAHSPKAAVIICPGGSYEYVSDREGESVALAFAKVGIQAFVLHYSVGQMTPPGQDPVSAFPQPMKDLAQALCVVRDHADTWQIDPERIGCCGFSAGGHNVAMFGNSWHDSAYYQDLTSEQTPVRPAFNLLAYPFTNYYSSAQYLKQMGELTESMDKQTIEWVQTFVNNSFGHLEPSDDQLKAWSPALTVNELTPPTFLWACQDDEVVPASQAIDLASALNDKGIKMAFHLFSSGGHGLSLATPATARHEGQVNESVEQWFKLAIDWLETEIF